MMIKVLKKIARAILGNKLTLPNPLFQFEHISYSQIGEDLIIHYIFNQLKIYKPTYLDLGAHHPHYLSNTYFFYKRGSSGVNIEPDPFLIEEFKKARPNDININVGIGFDEKKEADFFIMSAKYMNTFSEEEATRVQNFGSHSIEAKIVVPLLNVNQVIADYFKGTYPNFISIDIEGLDFDIIKTFDFKKFRPEVFCIETLTYAEDKSERKLTEIIEYMISKNYFLYADTYLNSIFVDNLSWLNRE